MKTACDKQVETRHAWLEWHCCIITHHADEISLGHEVTIATPLDVERVIILTKSTLFSPKWTH